MRITPPPRVTRVTTFLAVAAFVATGLAAPAAPAGAGAQTTAVPRAAFQRWSSTAALDQGTHDGTRARSGALSIARATGSTTYRGHRYDLARWTSPWASPGFGADEIVPSWAATTPVGTWIKVQVRGRTTQGRTGSWDTVANWASGDTRIERRSRGSQPDDYAHLATDTVVLDGSSRYSAWQVRVVLLRPNGSTASPSVGTVGAVASVDAGASRSTSATTMTRTVELPVPRYSQMIHEGEYPQWDGGGEAWCSPTATTMVLRSYGSGPTKQQYAWVDPAYRHRFVDHAARYTYDYRYEGTGNWPFNTAYAASFGLDAFVTRLTSLRDAESLIRAKIPVVASIAFARGQLTGAPISATQGHVVVIRGFASDGRVIVNDPAGASTSGVRRVYARGQFERAWLQGSGGTAYVIRPTSTPLPRTAGTASW